MSDAFEKILEGFTPEEAEEIRAKQNNDWTYPAFVLSQGSNGEVAVSIYAVPEGYSEAEGDILFRLPSMADLKRLKTYLNIAIPAIEEGPYHE